MPPHRSMTLPNPAAGWGAGHGRRGFTLIEIMVVVGIAAVLLTLAAPAFVRRLSAQSIQKAVNDTMDACSQARAHAILHGVTTGLRIRPKDRLIDVVVIGPNAGASAETPGIPSEAGPAPAPAPAGGASVFHVALDPSMTVEGLGINGEDWTEDPVAEVRFFPNGTSDELSLGLLSQNQERRNIWLEVVTGLAEMETDVKKFKAYGK